LEILIKYIFVAVFAAIKFMGAPAFGFTLNLSFWEVFSSTVIGGFFGFILFFNMSSYFMQLSHKKKIKKLKQINAKRTKIHTRKNKFLVKIKRSKFGYWLLILLTPSFISIPIGSILIAKFYSQRKNITLTMFFSILLCAYLYTFFSEYIVIFFEKLLFF
tara:strand:- start:17301 stop:17780 length:480 start_codon:yes stop_codon:yes gene_type:complete